MWNLMCLSTANAFTPASRLSRAPSRVTIQAMGLHAPVSESEVLHLPVHQPCVSYIGAEANI